MTSRPSTIAEFDAVIVAGGRARRLGGVDKGTLEWNGAALREHAVSAVRDARRVVWVGDPWAAGVAAGRLLFAREHPEYGGPAAAVHAGLESLPRPLAPWVVVIAVDVPRIAQAVGLLLDELDSVIAYDAGAPASDIAEIDGLIGLDSGGYRQPLLAVYRSAALRGAAVRRGDGLDSISMAELLGGLRLRELLLPDSLTADVDTAAAAASFGIRLPATVTEDRP